MPLSEQEKQVKKALQKQEQIEKQKQKAEEEEARAQINKQGIFGFGVSENSYLELLTIAFLACAGIIIKLCLSGSYSQSGTMGPASSTIWGYGLTAIALSIMAFIGIYLFSNKIFDNDTSKKISFLTTMLSILPIVLTLFVIIYIIYLNFSYFTRINSNKVTPDYHIFSGVSSALLIVKIILISMYLFHYITKTAKSDVSMSYIENIKNITYILCTINFILLFMIHINLAVFSTDE
jgi:hypothetical protein